MRRQLKFNPKATDKTIKDIEERLQKSTLLDDKLVEAERLLRVLKQRKLDAPARIFYTFKEYAEGWKYALCFLADEGKGYWHVNIHHPPQPTSYGTVSSDTTSSTLEDVRTVFRNNTIKSITVYAANHPAGSGLKTPPLLEKVYE